MPKEFNLEHKNLINVRFRLEQSENEASNLRAEVTSLRAQLAGREREVALYKEELQTSSELLEKYKERLLETEGQNRMVEKQ